MVAFKKITRWGLWIVLVLLALMAAGHFILPYAVNSSIVKKTIKARVQATVNGQLDYTKAELGILPRPYGTIIDARFSIPKAIDVSAASVSVSLKILPLLTGKVNIATLSVQSPVVELQLPKAEPSNAVSHPQLTRDRFKEKTGAVLGASTRWIRNGRLQVSNGILTLMRGTNRIQMEELDLVLAEADNTLKLEIQGRPQGIDRFNLKARINPASLDAQGRFNATGIRPDQLLAAWLPEKKIDIPGAGLDLSLTFESQGLETWRAILNGQIPEIPLSQDGRQVVQQVELTTTLTVAPDQVDVSLSRLEIKSPQVKLSGTLQWQGGSDEKDDVLQAAVQAETIDMTAVRQAAIAVLGDTPIYLDIVRGGLVSQLHAASRAAGWSGLVDVDNLVISGKVTDGSIQIPGPDMGFTEVAGNIAFARGTLQADQASARMGATTAANGRFSMNLMTAPPPLDLAVDLDVDLSQLPDLIRKFVRNKQVLAQLEGMTITQGRAATTLSLAGNLDDLNVTMNARDISLTLEDQRLPSALTLTGDQLSYSVDGIGFKNIGARLKGSRLSRLSGHLRWDPDLIIDLQDAGADLACQEIYPLLTAALDQRLPVSAPKTLDGRIVVAGAAIRGPLTNPQQWQFKVNGDLKGIALETDLIPDPLTIKSGQFNIDPQKIAVSDLAVQWLDAALNISAGANGYQSENPLIDLKALTGKLGDRAATWIHQRLNLAQELRIHTPVSIKAAQGRWQRDEGLQLQGDLMWPGSLNITLALSAGSREINLDHLRISDDASDATITLRQNGEAGQWDIGYKGHLDKTSLAKLWRRDELLIGEMDGDFSASITVDDPQQSVLRGQLEARQLTLPIPGLDPITIKEARISADNQILNIHNFDLAWLQQELQLTGEIDFGGDLFQLNLALLSDDLDLTRIEKALTKDDAEKKPPAGATPQRPQPRVQGLIKLDIARLHYDHYLFQPLKGDLVIQEDSTIIDVTQASLCGLTTEGRIELTGQGLSIDLRPIATGQTLQYTGECLSGTDSTERYEGIYNVDGRLSTRGQNRTELIQGLDGRLQINIKDGRILNAGSVGVFTNLLAYLSINNLFSGGTLERGTSAFRFSALSLRMDVDQGQITLSEAHLNSNSLNIVAEGTMDLPTQQLNLTVLVSPLTTVDSLVSLIPILGNILQGTLVAVPVRVRGDIANPDIIPLSPGAIGTRLTGILTRTLQAPFQIINPDNYGRNTTGGQKERQTETKTGTPEDAR